MRFISGIALFFLSVSTASAGFADFNFGNWSLGSKKGTQTLVFSTDLTSTASVLSPARGTGPGTFTGGGQWVADYQGVLTFVASGNPAIPGSRIVGNTCYDTLVDGTPIAGIKGVLFEPAATNYFLNSAAPVTQNISVTTANSGKWTATVWGAGTVTSSAGTATATGYGAASSGSPRTITVTGNGTVTFTVSGANATTRVNVENTAFGTSYIATVGSSASRAATILSYPASAMRGNSLALAVEMTPWSSITTTSAIFYSGDANNRLSAYIDLGAIFNLKMIAGVSYLAARAVVPAQGVTTKIASSFSSQSGVSVFSAGVKGGTVSANTASTSVGDTLYVGSYSGAAFVFYGQFKNIRIWREDATDANMITRTQ